MKIDFYVGLNKCSCRFESFYTSKRFTGLSKCSCLLASEAKSPFNGQDRIKTRYDIKLDRVGYDKYMIKSILSCV